LARLAETDVFRPDFVIFEGGQTGKGISRFRAFFGKKPQKNPEYTHKTQEKGKKWLYRLSMAFAGKLGIDLTPFERWNLQLY